MFTGKGDVESSEAIGKALSAKMPKGWTCVHAGSDIVISYSKPIYMLNTISLHADPNLDVAKGYGWKSNYFIVLHFVHKCSNEELDLLRRNRTLMMEKIGKPVTKDKYSKLLQIERKYPLPVYYNKYSIFLSRPDCKPIATYPESFNQQKRSVFAEIEAFLKKYDWRSEKFCY